jgi:WD40 repeat protein
MNESGREEDEDDAYKCPLTHNYYVDPVVAADGYVYERDVIERWLKNNNTSPMTKEVMKHTQISECFEFNNELEDFYSKNPMKKPKPKHKPNISKVLTGHTGWVKSIVILSDGLHIVSTSQDKTVRVWNMESGECEKILKGHINHVNSISRFYGDDLYVVSGSEDNTIRIWNTQTGHQKKELNQNCGIRSVAISSDNRWIVSGSSDRNIRVWNIERHVCEKIMEKHSRDNSLEYFLGVIWSVAISPDDRWIVSGHSDATVCVWDFESGVCNKELKGHTKSVYSVAISSDGCWIVSGSKDTTIRIWNLASGVCEKVLKGHAKAVYSVAISPNGLWLVSGSEDKTIRVWNFATGVCENVLEDHSDCVRSIAITSDSLKIVSGSDDHTIRISNLRKDL